MDPNTNATEETEKNTRNTEEADRLFRLAGELDTQGNKPAAIAAYRKGVKLAPGTVWATFNLGMILSESKEYDEALQWLRRAVDLADPDNHADVRMVKRARQEIARCLDMLASTEDDPSGGSTYAKLYGQGKVIVCTGGPKEYLEAAKKCLTDSSCESYAELQRERFAQAMIRAGIPQEARTEFLERLRISDDDLYLRPNWPW